jgi:hypothetical protein
VQTDKPQKAEPTGPIVNSDEAPLSTGQTLAPMTDSVSKIADLGEGHAAKVYISDLTMTKILEKRLGRPGVEYKCELEPFWLQTW